VGSCITNSKGFNRANPQNAKIIRNEANKGVTIGWKYRRTGKRGKMELRPEEERIVFDSSITSAFVTPDVWHSANDQTDANAGEPKPNERLPYLLRDFVYCAKCGRK
jgi:hypothetical protein